MEKKEIHIKFWWEGEKEGEHSVDLDACEMTILKWFLVLDGKHYIDLTQLRALVSTLMKLQVPKNVGTFLKLSDWRLLNKNLQLVLVVNRFLCRACSSAHMKQLENH
jgi:hypothetical protein